MTTEPWPDWHCITIDESADGWVVDCTPHGRIADTATHLEAFDAALQHDWDNGTVGDKG